MSAAADTVAPGGLAFGRSAWWRSRPAAVGATAVAILVTFFLWKNDLPWSAWLQWDSLIPHLDHFQTWLLDKRNADHTSPAFSALNQLSSFLDNLVDWLTRLFEWVTWAGMTIASVLVVWRFGGVRAGLLIFGAFASFALMGLWEASIQTLALMLAAVSLSLLVGIPLGVVAGRSDRFQRAITPVLDAMQIVPAFAYLMPIVIFFSVGPGAAVVTTMIYAVPPAVRITALGIRGVAASTVEAAQAMGATRPQVLTKVQLPLARRMLLLSVNQTILFALSMVVIAGLIGGQGLGDVVTSGLYSNPALALLGGFAIVILAIALDRSTQAIAERTDPARRHLDDAARRRLRLLSAGTALVIAVAVALARVVGVGPIYPDETTIRDGTHSVTVQDWLLARVQSVLDYVQNPASAVFKVTEPVGNFLVQYGLEPLQSFFIETPWPAMLLGLTLVAYLLSGLRPAVITFVMLMVVGVSGEWAPAMDTASQVLVATALAVAIGFALGVWAAESPRADRLMRPVLDVLQTLPQLVYIIPMIYLFPVSIVPGVIASVLYAAPIVIRLVATGIRDVSPDAVEAAGAFGATRRQVLTKVKIPLARDAIMLGVNQGIVMVLAVVVIAGLVGSGALGYEVAQGLQRNEFGLGVVASIAILALGIALDRVTQGRHSRSR